MNEHGYIPLRLAGTSGGPHLAAGYGLLSLALQGLLGLKVNKELPAFLIDKHEGSNMV